MSCDSSREPVLGEVTVQTFTICLSKHLRRDTLLAVRHRRNTIGNGEDGIWSKMARLRENSGNGSGLGGNPASERSRIYPSGTHILDTQIFNLKPYLFASLTSKISHFSLFIASCSLHSGYIPTVIVIHYFPCALFGIYLFMSLSESNVPLDLRAAMSP